MAATQARLPARHRSRRRRRLLLSVASAVHLAASSTRCFMLLRQPLGGSRGSEQHPPLARGGGARSNGCRFNPKNVFLSDLFDQRDSANSTDRGHDLFVNGRPLVWHRLVGFSITARGAQGAGAALLLGPRRFVLRQAKHAEFLRAEVARERGGQGDLVAVCPLGVSSCVDSRAFFGGPGRRTGGEPGGPPASPARLWLHGGGHIV
eukprot:COSAG06_NODE_176_length_21031_cov_66.751290_7_plen_206_part_00